MIHHAPTAPVDVGCDNHQPLEKRWADDVASKQRTDLPRTRNDLPHVCEKGPDTTIDSASEFVHCQSSLLLHCRSFQVIRTRSKATPRAAALANEYVRNPHAPQTGRPYHAPSWPGRGPPSMRSPILRKMPQRRSQAPEARGSSESARCAFPTHLQPQARAASCCHGDRRSSTLVHRLRDSAAP